MPTFPFAHSTDQPLYAAGESPSVSISNMPASDARLGSERILSRADRVSAFFKALCQRYRPPQHVCEAVPESTTGLDDFPVNWTHEQPPLPQSGDPPSPPIQRPVRPLPEGLRGGVLQKAIYRPHGKWRWTAGLPFRDSEPPALLSSGIMCSAFLKTGHIGDRPVKYVSKVWLTKERWHGFFSELALYKVQLKSLQGRVVPSIINVYSCPGAVDVAMEPPHHSFWIEASADMPHVLKKRCVKAFEELHAAGVYHGDIELRHMLIGGDARVTLIDFQASRALVPNEAVRLAAATPDELRLEMRKVKFKLDYEDARAKEDERLMRAARLQRRNQRGFVREQPSAADVRDPPVDSREWNLEWIGPQVEPLRFVMPGQSAEDIEREVWKFLDILEKLEKEEELCQDEGITKLRRASPDSEPPAVVPIKSPGVPLTGALKRKSDCDRTQGDNKRIRSAPSPTHSPPPPYRSPSPTLPPHPVAPEPPVSLLPACGLMLAPTMPFSPGKRRHSDVDTGDEPLDTRGKPKARTTLSSDVSSASAILTACESPASPRVSQDRSKDVTFVAVQNPSHAPHKDMLALSTPVIFRWIENLWRFVA